MWLWDTQSQAQARRESTGRRSGCGPFTMIVFTLAVIAVALIIYGKVHGNLH